MDPSRSQSRLDARDRAARDRLAEAVRQLASGTITNDQFEDGQLPGGGRAASEVYHFAWCFYDDLYEHRLRGPHRLSPLQRRIFANCVLFLRSDLEYEWPRWAKWLWCRQRAKPEPRNRIPWWRPDALVLSTLPIFGHYWTRKWMPRFERARDRQIRRRGIVDQRIWPFRRTADYRAALRRPLYLAGTAR